MQPTWIDRDVAFAARARAALKALYLVSGAAAQLGAYGQKIQDAQWQALAGAARNASTALGAGEEGESEAIAAFRRLTSLCSDLLDRRAMGLACPSAIWRDLARLGREAYEQLDA